MRVDEMIANKNWKSLLILLPDRNFVVYYPENLLAKST